MFGLYTNRDVNQLVRDLAAATSRCAVLEGQATERALRLAELRDQNVRLTGEVSRLTDLVAQMKREGFHPAVTVAEVEVPRRDLPEQVQAEIDRLAAPRSELNRRLTQHAWELINGNADTDEVVRRIRYGRNGPPDDEDEG